jgi:hypothetical protein
MSGAVVAYKVVSLLTIKVVTVSDNTRATEVGELE